jgi:hypothetical protein
MGQREQMSLDERVYIEAIIGGGHVKVLKWAFENSCHLSILVCEEEATIARLDVIIWVTENECSWGNQILMMAIYKGNIEALACNFKMANK